MSLLRIAVVPLQILLPVFMALTAPAASILLERRIEAAEQPASVAERCLRLQMFVRSDSALCQEALKSAEAFAQRRVGICVEVLDLAAHKATLERYWQTVMFDDSLMVIVFVVTLSHRKMRELEGRWLKLISGVVVLVLGFAILFRPDWLQW
jgi:hypothetical protein